ncbi:uncharacterized protein LOC108096509 [Drosophila ficusphila]|uniref:uncharacterized protein LOC108096509 n=1 Tax=Drosophila ficusphila TaxID=30025 RepID=UPI001C8938AB|nr:uncharacterized protein LOC108096509 [Drosophila ficusphila]
MGKKNKSKKYRKKDPLPPTLEEPETQPAESSEVVEEKVPEPKETPPEMNSEATKEQVERIWALATIPLRLDKQILCIKDVQQQLFKLHLHQMTLLDGCTEFLQELNAVQPSNALEAELIMNTFGEVKSKLSQVFEHFLPAQLDMLKHEMKILQVTSKEISK